VLKYNKISMASLLAESMLEMVGTFVFLLSVFIAPVSYNIAIALFVAIILFGQITGHFNFTISLAKYVQGAINGSQLASFGVAQFIGGVAALGVSQLVASATAK
jgi:glycerol uptake facilitator-like aquaporin